MEINENRIRGELLVKTGVLSIANEKLDELLNGDAEKRRSIIDEYGLDCVRVCSVCGGLMEEGWLDEDSGDTYCSEECVKKANGWSDEDFNEWSRNWTDCDPLFWTQWY